MWWLLNSPTGKDLLQIWKEINLSAVLTPKSYSPL